MADEYVRGKLQHRALWLVGVFSWIPDDNETIAFIENFGITELLFEVALETMVREGERVSSVTRHMLLVWAFKGGRPAVGWAILERSLTALAILALWQGQTAPADWLKVELAKRLKAKNAPDLEIHDNAARELRRTAETLYRSGI